MTLERFTDANAPSPKASAPNLKRILYVEDDDTNWDVAVLGLKDSYHLERAATAQQAFAKLRSDAFDAVLMDIELAGSELNGIQITEILRSMHRGIVPEFAKNPPVVTCPIIFVTAYKARYSREDLLRSGGDEMIPKPVDFMRLSFALSKLVARKIIRG